MTKTKTESIKALEHGGMTWIDIENPSRRSLLKLSEKLHFHPFHVDEALLTRQLPRLDEEDDYLFLLLGAPTRTRGNLPNNNQVSIFVGKTYVITAHDEAVTTIREWFATCQEDADYREKFFQNSTGILLHNIISNTLDTVAKLVQKTWETIEDIEDHVFDNKTSDIFVIGQLRKKIIRLKRLVSSLSVVLRDLTTARTVVRGERLRHLFKTDLSRNEKLWELIEEARETVEVFKDADFTMNTERTNEILAVLTIISTFGIPATVLGTFYGMNVLLPGGIETGAWNFFGPYTTFILIIVVSAIPAVAMYWYFKKKGRI